MQKIKQEIKEKSFKERVRFNYYYKKLNGRKLMEEILKKKIRSKNVSDIYQVLIKRL